MAAAHRFFAAGSHFLAVSRHELRQHMQSLTNGTQPIAACAPWGYSIREAARVSASASSHDDSHGTLNDNYSRRLDAQLRPGLSHTA